MTKKHIVTHGYRKYAFDSVTAAAAAVAFFAKLKPVKLNTDSKSYDGLFYQPDTDRDCDVSMELNQKYKDPAAAVKKPEKALALPAPKRGTILCICEKSYVAPRESCPHCGRSFSESHNRTHQDNKQGPNLRLI
jgi:hypothetical protein